MLDDLVCFHICILPWIKIVTHLIMFPILLASCWKHDELKCYIFLITYMKVIYITLIETFFVWLIACCNCVYGKSFYLYVLKNEKNYGNKTIQKLIEEDKMHIFSLESNKKDNIKEIMDLECTICLSNFNMKRQIIKLNCSHIFHMSCISTWIDGGSHTCPCCREVIYH
jgi:hypothetical protein